MKKLFIYLFIMTAGLLSATQVSAQKEIAPEVIKLQKGEMCIRDSSYTAAYIQHCISRSSQQSLQRYVRQLESSRRRKRGCDLSLIHI